MLHYLAIILILSTSALLLAQTNDPSKNKEIVFLVKKKKIIGPANVESRLPGKDPVLMTGLSVEEEEVPVPVSIEKIISTINETKRAICSAVGKSGVVKFWLKAGTEAKIFGIGGSSESGIEVSVQCID